VKAVVLSLLGFCASGWAQSISVYSELAQIDASGKVIAPETPREILSPAVVRNGFTSFQVVVEAPAETTWRLFVGQNPENSVKVTMYRESGANLAGVGLPYESSGTQVLWMDLWTEGTAPVQRIKVEPELHVNDDWVTYPIEGRVTEARIPAAPAPSASMHGYLCGSQAPGAPPERSLQALRSRNAQQDVRLLTAHAGVGEDPKENAKEDVKKLLGECEAQPPSDPEWYLPIRDYLFRLR
jgi:hypothetical protein